MKYEIPDIEKEVIACIPKYKSTTMKNCFKCEDLSNCFEINLQQIKDSIILQCEKNNEIKFCEREKCDNCNSKYIRTCGGFLCPNCGQIISLTNKQLKATLKKEFEEIDNEELDEELEKLKTKFLLVKEHLTLNEEEKQFVKLNKKQKTDNIITFKKKENK